MKTNYVLIDYENVQPTDIAVLDEEHFKIKVFLGATQGKIAFEVVSVLQRMGQRAEYIKICGNGPNAVDFHIAFYIGVTATQEPDAYFHIISNDTGFDPLIQHLRERKIAISRTKSVQDIPIIRIRSAISVQDRMEAVRINLQQRKASRPRTVKTLSSTINSLFGKSLTTDEITAITQELQRKRVIEVVQEKVNYHFSTDEISWSEK